MGDGSDLEQALATLASRSADVLAQASPGLRQAFEELSARLAAAERASDAAAGSAARHAANMRGAELWEAELGCRLSIDAQAPPALVEARVAAARELAARAAGRELPGVRRFACGQCGRFSLDLHACTACGVAHPMGPPDDLARDEVELASLLRRLRAAAPAAG